MRETPGKPKQSYALMAFALFAAAATPRCNCDTEPGLQRAAVQMKLTLVEVDSCTGQAVPRDIPDTYEEIGLAMATDFGSRAERVFEVRSIGTAPLNVQAVSLSEVDEEFTVELLAADDMPATLPMTIVANRDVNVAPPLRIRVSYAANDDVSDLVKLVVETDDPKRSMVEFDLAAGRGKLEVCGTNGCVADAAIVFGNVLRGDMATQQLTLRNVGEGDLDLRSIDLESDSAEFCAPEATSLPPGVPNCTKVDRCKVLKPAETYVINIQYSPIDGGEDTGVVRIASGDAARGNVDVPINGTGAGPAVCVCVVNGPNCDRVSVVDFGFVDVGVAESRTIRLESCGTEPVMLNEAALEDDAANFYFTDAEFQITQPFTTGLIQPGAFSEGAITYAPNAGGLHDGGLRYVVTQDNLRSWLGLLGKAATCDLEPLPQSVNFGQVAGGTTNDRTVQLVNNGAKECVVSAITDPNTAEFSLVNKPALPLTIAPGASHDLTARYAAPNRQQPAGDTATFQVTSDEPAPDSSFTVNLLAQGGGTPVCVVDVQPTRGTSVTGRDGQINFGAVNIGYRQTQPIRITNLGNTDCVLQSFNLVTQDANEFSVTTATPVPMVIAPQQTGAIEVTFHPTHGLSTFPWYGTLLNHVDFTLQGTGLMKTEWSIGLRATPTVPTIDVIPAELDFGVVTWDRPQAPDNRSSCGSEVRAVRIYNSGNGNLTVNSITVDPSSDLVFSIISVTQGGSNVQAPYTMQIPAGNNAEVQLRFFPTRVNPPSHSGLLVIDNSVTMQTTVPLRGEGTTNAMQTDRFDQLTGNKVDILWVIDDSCSMSDEQSDLAQNIQWFTNYASQLNADWQMAVTTTEVNDAASGEIWACTGFNKVIRHTDPMQNQAFQCAANVTNPPGGNRRPNPGGSDEQEAGLQAARLALEPPTINMQNAGFLRPDARLAVIIVSDEEDQSQGSVSLYVDFFRQLKGFRNPQLTSLSAIAGDVPNGCATAAAAPRYRDAAMQLGGQFDSVCNQDWTQMLQNIGLDVFALRHSWTLSRPADPMTIVVRVDGNSVPQNSGNGFTFDPASNSISFHGSSIPNPGASVEVTYGALCLP